jgi:hypothetical protein
MHEVLFHNDWTSAGMVAWRYRPVPADRYLLYGWRPRKSPMKISQSLSKTSRSRVGSIQTSNSDSLMTAYSFLVHFTRSHIRCLSGNGRQNLRMGVVVVTPLSPLTN